MGKFLVMSCLVALIVLPIRASKLARPGASFRRAVVSVALFNVAYWLVVLFGYYILWGGRDPSRLMSAVH